MDSLSQIVLGGAVAAACVPAPHRRAALLAGAALGTLPDLDGLPVALLTADPVLRMTWHRGPSHSLLVLPFAAWAIWAWHRRRGARVAQAPRAWFWAIFLALITHPMLDAFTVYGTQLWWPLPVRPAMGSSVFIIDPLYTVWLLLACIVAWAVPRRPLARGALLAGLALSCGYLAWSVAAKAMVERAADAALAPLGLAGAPRFSVPMPFNTLLWRVVAMTPDGYVVGDRSVLVDRAPMRFTHHASDTAALAEVAGAPAVRRLNWFNHGFMRAQARGDALVLSDLRMGLEPAYTFNFAVAARAGGRWRPIAPQAVPAGEGGILSPGGLAPAWRAIWRRIWHEPAVGS
ncbi:metal-dependent hydrolase [Ottowia sp.]|jgi:inner membrane protein|uniref:metal-dependent hydrolase n=1 Tax=Ottowia sp. TaxID=1898956 RepID=UPI0025E7434E|nr:metal-dependent hydrolase [Ottowia sp.]MBK6613900.1 metal-dependent hydrolase [Ottowia sp.]MBK6745538.1 metal-dependent hydrolase [Ottowia sp.]